MVQSHVILIQTQWRLVLLFVILTPRFKFLDGLTMLGCSIQRIGICQDRLQNQLILAILADARPRTLRAAYASLNSRFPSTVD